MGAAGRIRQPRAANRNDRSAVDGAGRVAKYSRCLTISSAVHEYTVRQVVTATNDETRDGGLPTPIIRLDGIFQNPVLCDFVNQL